MEGNGEPTAVTPETKRALSNTKTTPTLNNAPTLAGNGEPMAVTPKRESALSATVPTHPLRNTPLAPRQNKPTPLDLRQCEILNLTVADACEDDIPEQSPPSQPMDILPTPRLSWHDSITAHDTLQQLPAGAHVDSESHISREQQERGTSQHNIDSPKIHQHTPGWLQELLPSEDDRHDSNDDSEDELPPAPETTMLRPTQLTTEPKRLCQIYTNTFFVNEEALAAAFDDIHRRNITTILGGLAVGYRTSASIAALHRHAREQYRKYSNYVATHDPPQQATPHQQNYSTSSMMRAIKQGWNLTNGLPPSLQGCPGGTVPLVRVKLDKHGIAYTDAFEQCASNLTAFPPNDPLIQCEERIQYNKGVVGRYIGLAGQNIQPVPSNIALLDGYTSNTDINLNTIEKIETAGHNINIDIAPKDIFHTWQLCLRFNNTTERPESSLWAIAHALKIRIILFQDNLITDPPLRRTPAEEAFMDWMLDHPDTSPYPSYIWERAIQIYKTHDDGDVIKALEQARTTHTRHDRHLIRDHRLCPRGLELCAFIEPPSTAASGSAPTAWVFKDPRNQYYPVIIGMEASNTFMIDSATQYFQGKPLPFTILTAVLQQHPGFPQWRAYATANYAWRQGVKNHQRLIIQPEFNHELTRARQLILDYILYSAPVSPEWKQQTQSGWRRLARLPRSSPESITTL